jgi:uncharacterized protein (TIGR03083 family)
MAALSDPRPGLLENSQGIQANPVRRGDPPTRPRARTAYMEAMEANDHIAALERDGHLLLSAAQSASLDAAVPACPGWAMRDLLAHIGFVHHWAGGYVQNGRTEMADEPDEAGVIAVAPPDDELLPWVAEGHASLVNSLAAAPADLRCWTFLGAPSPLAFWARRQAHETAIHRVDAERAAGLAPSDIGTPFAADGIDELLLGFLARPGSRRYTKVPPGTVALEATDAATSWSVAVSGSGIVTKRGSSAGDLSASDPSGADPSGAQPSAADPGAPDPSAPDPSAPDLVVRGRAKDLYLLVWNRRTPEGLDLDGRADLLHDWRELFRVTWS